MNPIDQDIREVTGRFDWLGYDSGPGDNDHDGKPNRADPDNGAVDCTGWEDLLGHELAKLGHWGGVKPTPLGNTSTLSRYARIRGWRVGLENARAGDAVIYASNGDPENSDGPVGHWGRIVQVDGAFLWTSESRGRGVGVGIYRRERYFWTMAYREPDSTVPVSEMSEADKAAWRLALEELDVNHGMVADAVCAAGQRRITLDVFGGIHAVDRNGAKIEIEGTGWWPQQHVARELVLVPRCHRTRLAALRGWVIDMDGGWHPFAEKGKKKPSAAPAPAYWDGGKIVSFDESVKR